MVHRLHGDGVQLQPPGRPGESFKDPLRGIVIGSSTDLTPAASEQDSLSPLNPVVTSWGTGWITRTASAQRTGSAGSSGRRTASQQLVCSSHCCCCHLIVLVIVVAVIIVLLIVLVIVVAVIIVLLIILVIEWRR